MKKLEFVLIALIVFASGCQKQNDSRIHVREEVASDTLGSNIVTRRNNAGFLELYVNGHNRSFGTKRFRYRVEWLDEDGIMIETKTSVWLPMSAMGKSPFSIKAVAPRPQAVNFRMDTRKWE